VLPEPSPQPRLSGITPTLEDIERAARRIAGQVEVTPFLHSRTLSQIAQAEVWLKFENLQFTASFKERGALNRLSVLSARERSRGVIAMSAGNHAQGVAFHAQRMGIPTVIVMPRFSPSVKVERTRGFGAEVILAGETFDDARVEAERLMRERGLTMVHPYDDVEVIAGQGTVGVEMLAAQPDLQCLCVAIGGGGLISGMSIAARSLRPDIEIVGVQTERFPAMYAAFKGVTMPCANATLAEGIAVKSPSELTAGIVRRLVDDVVLVGEGDIEHAIVLLLEIEKTVVEGAGGAGLAALLRQRSVSHAVLVGSSHGGELSIDFTLQYPGVVKQLVVVGAVVNGFPYSDHFLNRGMNNSKPFEKNDVAAGLANWAKDRYLLAPGHEAAQKRLMALLTANPQDMTHSDYARPTAPAIGRLHEIRVPTLILVGDADIPDVHAQAGAIEAGIPGSKRVVISDAGHLMYMEKPAEFGQRVISFIESNRF